MFKANGIDGEIDMVTNEKNTETDWALVLAICDKMNLGVVSMKDSLKVIWKKMGAKNPHISLQAITLLDACVQNCGKPFHRELTSRDNINQLRNHAQKTQVQVSAKLCAHIKKWTEEFKNDRELALMTALYNELLAMGMEFADSEGKKQERGKGPTAVTEQEMDDIAKAIEASLRDPQDKSRSKGGSAAPQSASSAQPPSLYPANFALLETSSTFSGATSVIEHRRVKVICDFPAAESDELTLTTGEVVQILDDSNADWWKGRNDSGDEGVFPSGFVTSDLSFTTHPRQQQQQGSQRNNMTDEHNVEVTRIDVGKIDQTLLLLQNADPSGEMRPDTDDLRRLERECKLTVPLVDKELETIDTLHSRQMEVHQQLNEALQLYNDLMQTEQQASQLTYGGYQQGYPTYPDPAYSDPSYQQQYQPPQQYQQPIQFQPQPPMMQQQGQPQPMMQPPQQQPLQQQPMMQQAQPMQPPAPTAVSQPPVSASLPPPQPDFVPQRHSPSVAPMVGNFGAGRGNRNNHNITATPGSIPQSHSFQYAPPPAEYAYMPPHAQEYPTMDFPQGGHGQHYQQQPQFNQLPNQ